MESAGYQIREEDPFLTNTPIDFSVIYKPAYRSRLEVMWHDMRNIVRENFLNPVLRQLILKDIWNKLTKIMSQTLIILYLLKVIK